MSAYIQTNIDTAEFTLPYSDKDGVRLKVWFDKKGNIFLTDNLSDNTRMMIDASDIDWLRQVLDDIKNLLELREETNQTQK